MSWKILSKCIKSQLANSLAAISDRVYTGVISELKSCSYSISKAFEFVRQLAGCLPKWDCSENTHHHLGKYHCMSGLQFYKS